MNAAFVGLCAALAIAGVLSVVSGLISIGTPTTSAAGKGESQIAATGYPQVSTTESTGLWKNISVTWQNRWKSRWTMANRTQRIVVIVAVASGVLGFAVTRLVVVAVILPGLIMAAPSFLRHPEDRDIQILEALDRWVRLLIGSVSTGKSIPDAIRATRSQVAPLLRDPVDELIARLDARWPADLALREMAEHFESPDADSVISALIVAARRGGTGASALLRALGDHTRHRLQALREIEMERTKPMIVVRQVTMITTVVLVGVCLISTSYMSPYASATGQIIGIVLFLGYLGSLIMLRKIAAPRQRQRILQGGLIIMPATRGADHD